MKNNEKTKLLTTKKKIIAYTTLATLSASVLTGCGNNNDDYSTFTYETTEDGNIKTNGTISYEILKNYIPIKINNIYGEETIFITEKKEQYIRMKTYAEYTDILTNKIIIDQDDNLDFEELEPMNNHLISMQMIKNEYTEDDIKQIITHIKENEEQIKPKTKEKVYENKSNN